MLNRSEIEARVLAELRDGLWHTTHPDRYTGILSTGAILPNPDIPDSDRWKILEAAIITRTSASLVA
jgi:hypothetical protein